MGISFAKAVKYEAKGRIALIGPAGSGKSYTMLTAARTLAGPDGRIAAIDTEQGSLAKYADQFDFDVCPLSEFTAQNFLEALHTAEKEGYSVFCVDSLSHFWIGRGGALEFVDNAGRHSSSRDGMSGWKEWRPWEQQMIDAMISSPCHILATMRTKTAYEEQVNPKTGKKQRVKIGLAPVQRDGLEYEFDLVGSMDEDNALIVDKTRCSVYAGKAITKPKEKDFAAFRDWLSGEPAPKPEDETKPEPKAAEQPKVDDATLEANRAKWLDTIAPMSKEVFAEEVVGKMPEDVQRTLVMCANDAVLASCFNRLDTPESFSAFFVPLNRVAFEIRKDFIKLVRAEAQRRGYEVDRVNGAYVQKKEKK